MSNKTEGKGLDSLVYEVNINNNETVINGAVPTITENIKYRYSPIISMLGNAMRKRQLDKTSTKIRKITGTK